MVLRKKRGGCSLLSDRTREPVVFLMLSEISSPLSDLSLGNGARLDRLLASGFPVLKFYMPISLIPILETSNK